MQHAHVTTFTRSPQLSPEKYSFWITRYRELDFRLTESRRFVLLGPFQVLHFISLKRPIMHSQSQMGTTATLFHTIICNVHTARSKFGVGAPMCMVYVFQRIVARTWNGETQNAQIRDERRKMERWSVAIAKPN